MRSVGVLRPCFVPYRADVLGATAPEVQDNANDREKQHDDRPRRLQCGRDLPIGSERVAQNQHGSDRAEGIPWDDECRLSEKSQKVEIHIIASSLERRAVQPGAHTAASHARSVVRPPGRSGFLVSATCRWPSGVGPPNSLGGAASRSMRCRSPWPRMVVMRPLDVRRQSSLSQSASRIGRRGEPPPA